MFYLHIRFICVIFFLIWPLLVVAQTMYVSDELTILMRADKGNQYRILKSLPSGSRLKVIEVDKNGYSKVVTEEGKSGWVLSRFLKKEPIARTQLKQAIERADKLNQEKKLLQQELSKLKKDKSLLTQSEKDLQDRNSKITDEVVKLRKIAARPMQLEKNNEKLRNELLENEAQTRILKQELQALRDDSEKQWFMTGAAILFGGILLGLILPNLRTNPQRKQNWNRL